MFNNYPYGKWISWVLWLMVLTITLVPGVAYAQCRVPGPVNGQDFQRILDNPDVQEKLDVGITASPAFRYMTIPVGFACSQIVDTGGLGLLNNARIIHVTYTHSAYKTAQSFRQNKLDRERLHNLKKRFPEWFTDEQITWKTVVQTYGANTDEAASLFHGFIIYYRPEPTEELTKQELRYLDEAIKTVDTTHDVFGYVEELVVTKRRKYDKGRSGYYIIYDTGVVTIDTMFGDLGFYSGNFHDTIIPATLNRNSQWQNMLVVADLTASMSPYTAQLFRWFHEHMGTGKVGHFTFFNDGDEKPNYLKELGNTGGIYHTAPGSFDSVLTVAKLCMQNGTGGDAPENDIEAIIEGMKSCPDCDEILLIADNLSFMRDYILMDTLERPVHVLLCATSFSLNMEYLNLARITGGSVHTLEGDIFNLTDYDEGEAIELNGEKYWLKNGRFVPVKLP